MKKVQVRELQKILQDHVSDTDKRISKAENILSSIEGEFNLVDETEEEEEEC